jgi:oligopeptide transport system ATP-binding protein
MSTQNSLLTVRNLHTSFPMREGVIRAVNGISLSMGQGEMLGIVGESGCGKSVTGLSIMRLIPYPGRITDGEVLFEHTDLLTLNDEQMRSIRGSSIAMIFQDPMTSLNPVLTIARQMTEAISAHTELRGRDARDRAVELLQTVGIPSAEKRIGDYPHQFSGGMRQRVMIAMALSCGPRILIADEPTTALDVTIQAQILDLMKKVCMEIGTSIMLITHDLGVVAGLCRQVAVMYAGRIVEMTDAGEVFNNPRHPYTYRLLTSTPRMDKKKERLQPISGLPPSLLDPPAHCLFAPRCEFTQDRCRQEVPKLENVKQGHAAACFRSDEALW